MFRLVILESPYRSSEPLVVEDNVSYARLCMRDSLNRGEAPFVSHLLYTQVTDESNDVERNMGIQAGLAWGEAMTAHGERAVQATVVYVDRGISPGMRLGIERAVLSGRKVEVRALSPQNKDRAQSLHDALRKGRRLEFVPSAECDHVPVTPVLEKPFRVDGWVCRCGSTMLTATGFHPALGV